MLSMPGESPLSSKTQRQQEPLPAKSKRAREEASVESNNKRAKRDCQSRTQSRTEFQPTTPTGEPTKRRQHTAKAVGDQDNRDDGVRDEVQLNSPLSIKRSDFPPSYRTLAPHLPPTRSLSLQGITDYVADRDARSLSKQRSKLHRANLRAQRDFPHTLETIASIPDTDSTDSEYTPISRADSTVTSGQSTPEASPEPISNEELFGFRAKPVSPAPPTPSTPSSPEPQAN